MKWNDFRLAQRFSGLSKKLHNKIIHFHWHTGDGKLLNSVWQSDRSKAAILRPLALLTKARWVKCLAHGHNDRAARIDCTDCKMNSYHHCHHHPNYSTFLWHRLNKVSKTLLDNVFVHFDMMVSFICCWSAGCRSQSNTAPRFSIELRPGDWWRYWRTVSSFWYSTHRFGLIWAGCGLWVTRYCLRVPEIWVYCVAVLHVYRHDIDPDGRCGCVLCA